MGTLSKKILVALLAVAPFLPSCDFPVDFWDNRTFTVDIQSGSAMTIDQTQTVNLDQDSAVAGNLSHLKSVSVPEIWVEVSNIQADNMATMVNGSLVITAPNDSSFQPIALSYQNVAITEGGKVNLAPSQDDLNSLQALIQSGQEFQTEYKGSIDQLPAHFDLTGKIHITADIST